MRLVDIAQYTSITYSADTLWTQFSNLKQIHQPDFKLVTGSNHVSLCADADE